MTQALTEILKLVWAQVLQQRGRSIVYADDGAAELLQISVGLEAFKGNLYLPACLQRPSGVISLSSFRAKAACFTIDRPSVSQ